MIELTVQFDRALLLTEFRPVKHTEAKVDGGGINTVKRVLEPKTVTGNHGTCLSNHGIEHLFEDLTVASLQSISNRI